MQKDYKIFLIGVGPGNRQLLTAEAEEALRQCDAVVGATRMLAAVKGIEKPEYACYQPEEIHKWILAHKAYHCIAVVLSGDSGFYSGAKKLEIELKKSEEYEVRIIAGISSVSYLAARLHVSWEDAKLASVHGRAQNYIQMIASARKTFLLCGGNSCGQEICEKLRYYGLEYVTVCVGRDLSYDTEEIIRKKAGELEPEDLEGMCTVFVENPFPTLRAGGGIPDDQWIRGKVPMTKEEVRTISIDKLHLSREAVLYDIGAGTGSVGIQAALQSESIRIYAVEKNPQGIALIEQNRRKFRTDWVQIIEGTAPSVLEDLEPPTHVFIGGSSGKLKQILSCVREKNPYVRIVLNAVSLETMREVAEAMEEGLLESPEIVQVSVAKSRKLGGYHMMTGQNPVYVISQ